MDVARFNDYLARYGYCTPIVRSSQREILRAQGRSLQSLHEKALAYVKGLDIAQSEKTHMLKALRKKYNFHTSRIKRLKKDAREDFSFYDRYKGKIISIKTPFRTIVGEIRYPEGWLKIRTKDGDFLPVNPTDNVEVIEDAKLPKRAGRA